MPERADQPVADCGHSTEQDGEWPGETGTVCFACWERECSQSWWVEMARLERAMVGLTYRGFLLIARRHSMKQQLWRVERVH